MLVEKVSGQALGDYLRDHVFAPLKLNSTCCPRTASFPTRTPTGTPTSRPAVPSPTPATGTPRGGGPPGRWFPVSTTCTLGRRRRRWRTDGC
ncbi:serine hydrolase [Streptomyces sp. H27-S2]|uniref:serine hydrolase n=1 Tax=Streptomyces antarcticus TaxID=2996458 RepID=UPI003B63A3FE